MTLFISSFDSIIFNQSFEINSLKCINETRKILDFRHEIIILAYTIYTIYIYFDICILSKMIKKSMYIHINLEVKLNSATTCRFKFQTLLIENNKETTQGHPPIQVTLLAH